MVQTAPQSPPRSIREPKPPRRRLDALDLEILDILQHDSSVSAAEVARRVELSPAGLQKRIKKLSESGVIRREVALLGREELGLDLLCFVQVGLAHHQPDAVTGFRRAVGTLPAVLECHHLTGEFDYMLKIVAANHRSLERFLVEKLTQIPGVDKVRTSIVLSEVKSSTALPMDAAPLANHRE